MTENFVDLLAVGGKSNSLGRANEVIDMVLNDRQRLDELYACLSHNDAWLRMRAADSFEKICRQHPEWIVPYIDKICEGLLDSTQPSIQWHLAQIFRQVELTTEQKARVIDWLKNLLSTKDVDWIVSANAMDTLAQFCEDSSVSKTEVLPLFQMQQNHKSQAVVKRANKLLAKLNPA